MPMTLRRGRTRLERADVDAEMRKAGGAGKPLARVPFHRFVERRRIAGRGAHTDPDAERDQRCLLVTPLEFIEHGPKNHGASRTEWMAHRDRAAIHVDLVV